MAQADSDPRSIFEASSSEELDYQRVTEGIAQGGDELSVATHLDPTGSHLINPDVIDYRSDTLLIQPLRLLTDLDEKVDIRYKTDYFPRGGKNGGQCQSPRYVKTEDGGRHVILQFPDGFQAPANPGRYRLEVAVVTVPRAGFHYIHVIKFQVDHQNRDTPDENPRYIELTAEDFQKGRITLKLVLIKPLQDSLRAILQLDTFEGQDAANVVAPCTNVQDLEHTYELSHAKIAFSLVCIDEAGNFDRAVDTTVMSKEIHEKRKFKETDVVEVKCPNCSHQFHVGEDGSKPKKRSASSSASTKAPASKRTKTTNETERHEGLHTAQELQMTVELSSTVTNTNDLFTQ